MMTASMLAAIVTAVLAVLLTHLAAEHRARREVARARGIDAANAFIRAVTLIKHTAVTEVAHERLTLPVADMEAAQRLVEVYFPPYVTEAARDAGDAAYALFEAVEEGEPVKDLQERMLDISGKVEFFTWATHGHLRIKQPKARRLWR